jgi:hypothetical protein
MTQVATQITLSLADRVRDWSRQERDLAIAIRGCAAPRPRPAPATVLPERAEPTVCESSPSVIDEPIPWIRPDSGYPSFRWIDREPRFYKSDHLVTRTEPAGPPGFFDDGEPAVPLDPPAVRPGPFDDFFDAVTGSAIGPTQPMAPLPPPTRFMLRVARVGQPHRATKRNYDYFEELNANLAAQAAARLNTKQR